MTTLNRKLWRELRQLYGQVLAISAVLAAGIATMVMALGNHAALSDSRALYYGQQHFADVFAQTRRAPLSLIEAVQEIPGVRQAQGRVVAFAPLEIEGFDEPATGCFVSLPAPGDPGLNGVHLRRGRLAVADDEIVVGEAFADAHALVPGDRLVAVLNGRRQPLHVVGIGLSPEFVYPIRPGDIFPDFRRFGVFWMAREPLAGAFDLDGAFNDLAVALDRAGREATVIDRLDALLAPYGGFGAHGRDLQVSHRFLDEELDQLRVMARMFSAIFLGVTAFLLNIVLGRLIAGQREQIAVLRAFGYGRGQVAAHYGQLALAMVAVGILPGLLLGAWMGEAMAGLYTEFYSLPYLRWRLPAGLVLLSLGFAVAAAAIGTAAALVRVFALTPAEAMRPEAPARFRRGLVERLGLGRLFGPAGRMIMRNLARRPLRSLMSVTGIALAGGILVMARFQAGAIDHMIEVQFGLAQRDDITVGFVEPTSGRAALDLASMPGVTRVEAFRTAAVNLRHGHRSHRTALLGLPQGEGAGLKRVLDSSLRPMPVPAEGVVLTDHLARMLAIRPGQSIEVDFLEGHRRTARVEVVGEVAEYLGVGVYASRATVNRLLDEGDAISGAWLALDEDARQRVVQRLRESPRVAFIGDRQATLQGFRSTMARGILTFTLIATLMAGCICVGVIYNAARLTLAERGRELASLRVLGYTRGEVRTLLAGELFALAFLAILPSALAGAGMAALLVQAFQSDLYRIPLVLPVAGFAFAALAVLASTALSTLLVQARLDAIDLVAALKSGE
ncbi:MAG: FtsX-like permease family protein [Xanthomonadales bacterium]|nr:FtsX-like permease family protein [Xanthomonadales bacterium]